MYMYMHTSSIYAYMFFTVSALSMISMFYVSLWKIFYIMTRQTLLFCKPKYSTDESDVKTYYLWIFANM